MELYKKRLNKYIKKTTLIMLWKPIRSLFASKFLVFKILEPLMLEEKKNRRNHKYFGKLIRKVKRYKPLVRFDEKILPNLSRFEKYGIILRTFFSMGIRYGIGGKLSRVRTTHYLLCECGCIENNVRCDYIVELEKIFNKYKFVLYFIDIYKLHIDKEEFFDIFQSVFNLYIKNYITHYNRKALNMKN